MTEYINEIRKIIDQKKSNGISSNAFVLTFGCQQNEADSERLTGLALEMGYNITDSPANADLIIVNTCAIREHAEKKTLSIIGQYKHLKSQNPNLIIAVGGCMTTQEHRQQEIKKSYPYVDIAFGTSSMHRLPELIFKRMSGAARQFCPIEPYSIREDIPVKRNSSYRAWVSVMYGCNNFCSYCIVPYVRGRERSRKPEDIINEVRDLASRGYRDITLLGQNVNSYGKDLEVKYSFADLMKELARIPGDFKLRFMTSHPKDATHDLIDTIASSEKIANHFHLPLQSGSDIVLKQMNRHYDTQKYLDTVAYMRKKVPDIALTTDIIVGFPGETEEDFEETLNILRKVKYDMIYSFIYSPRKGTPAAEMDCQISEEIKNSRFAKLLETQNQISAEVNKKYQDKIVTVLCDGMSKNDDNFYSGRTEGNKIVFFKGDERDIGKFIDIKIEKTEAFALYGNKI